MHPLIGWHPLFSYTSLFLILTIPAIIIMNIVSLSLGFFSVGKPDQLAATLKVLKFGVSWSLMLAAMPLLWVFLASAIPGLPPENFGTGDFRAKATLLVFSAATLIVGAIIRLATSVNPEGPEVRSLLFSKSIFYITGFLLEIMTVAAYAAFRIDLIYHVPNGAKGPGDYDNKSRKKSRLWDQNEIETEIRKIGVRYDILKSQSSKRHRPVFAILYPDSTKTFSAIEKLDLTDSVDKEFDIEKKAQTESRSLGRLPSSFIPKKALQASAMTFYRADD